ncbi:MAG: hypothetical protein ACYCV4_18890 [Dermatophilaceae bacterium]
MGTNYYYSPRLSDDPADNDHIGKWSATTPRPTFTSAVTPLRLAFLGYRTTIWDENGRACDGAELLVRILERDATIGWAIGKEFC